MSFCVVVVVVVVHFYRLTYSLTVSLFLPESARLINHLFEAKFSSDEPGVCAACMMRWISISLLFSFALFLKLKKQNLLLPDVTRTIHRSSPFFSLLR